MSPILTHDSPTVQHEAVDVHTSEDSMSSSTLHHAERVEQPLATAMLLALDEIAITAQAGKPSRDRCGEAQVFPITAIQVLSGRDQIRYMRLLRGIARAVGVPRFGSVTALLSNV